MARRKKNTGFKVNLFEGIYLLAKFFLIALGSIPILVIQKTVAFILDSSLIPHHSSLFRQSRKRGRPRKTLFFPFYFSRFKRSIYQKTSRRARIAMVWILAFFLFISYTTLIFETSQNLPTPEKLMNSDRPLTTEIYDRNGILLYRIYEGRNRSLVELGDLPPFLIQATIATEDKNFYSHFGFDPVAVIRAAYINIIEGRREGASTITQQLIKNSLLTPEKTISRKVREIILAFWAERIYSKDQILQMYFNEAPFGGPAWGIEAASQTYFGKSAGDLNLAEAAFLAGLPASPTFFSPYGTNPELAKVRQAYVLGRMAEEGFITETQRQEAISEKLNLKPPANNILAPHFVFYVKDSLAQKYGERVVSQGGLKIQTTLDLNLQLETEAVVKEEVEKLGNLGVKNGAAMITDAKTGQILAMVGSRDYYYPNFGNFNTTTALRQPGSSIKVVTYATAFKKGFSPGNTILDTPVVFKDEWGNSYSPVNYDRSYHGPVSIRTAFGSSYNIPAVRMLATLGLDPVIQTAKDLGITTFTDPQRYGLALTLGGAEVKMIDMMGVYGALSQMGKVKTPTPILGVSDSNGNVLEEYQNSSRKGLEPEIAYLINHILSDNKARTPAFGPNSLLNVSANVAVKTGTSDNKKDNWTFGYTNDFVVGVWVGNPDSSPMNPSLTSGVTGAAPIWNRLTKLMLAKVPASAFPKPAGIAEITLDGRKDLGLSNQLPKSLVRIKKDGQNLVFSDDFGTLSTSSAQANPELPIL